MIDRWVCVSCDGCGRAEEILEDAKLARRKARRNGWAVDLPPTPGSHKRRDLCPPCQVSAARVQASLAAAATAEEPTPEGNPAMTFAHDAHCNVIHDGPQECPPPCEDAQHVSAADQPKPCPTCGSTVLHTIAVPPTRKEPS